jgi:hypothetical protein
MNTTFHFLSASEVSNELLETIRTAYKEKPITITVEEEIYIPMWQKEEVLRRKKLAESNPDSMINFEAVMKNLNKEFDNEA